MTTHIQIPAVPPVIHYTGNGTQKTFSYPFPVFEADNMVVTLNGTGMTSGYTVHGVGKTEGGTVVFDTAPENGLTVTLKRQMTIQRTSDFIEGGELSSNALNNEFDRMTAAMQQVEYGQKNAVAFSTNEPAPSVVLPLTASRAGRVLGFDTMGRISMYDAGEATIPADYTQEGDHAITRLLREKASEFVSVQDFGATGNGVHDDSSAIRHALAAHDCVYFPTGTYKLNSTIEIGSHKKIIGAGATTILQASENNFDVLDLVGSHTLISDLVIEGGETGIRLYGKDTPCHHNILSSLVLRNQAVAIELDGYIVPANSCAHNTLQNIRIEDPSHYGILVTRSGAGTGPENNLFSTIHLAHYLSAKMDTAFFIEAGHSHNRFIHCSTAFTLSPNEIIRIGAESRLTTISNFQNMTPVSGNGIVLEDGSQTTSLNMIHMNSTGTPLSDLSGGHYTLLQPHDTLANSLKTTSISDLTTAMLRYRIRTIVSTGPITISADLSYVTHLVNAQAGEVTLGLPKAGPTNNGTLLIVKKIDTSNNFITLAETGGLGPDGLSLRLGTLNDVACIQSDGTAWRILHTNIDIARMFYSAGTTFYSPDVTKHIHFVSASSGVTTVELPPVNNKMNVGRRLTIKKLDNTANAVRITVAGGTGPDGAVASLTTPNAAITVVSSDSNWHILARL